MSRRIRIFQVDAFTTDRFTGNPAGVVLDADSLERCGNARHRARAQQCGHRVRAQARRTGPRPARAVLHAAHRGEFRRPRHRRHALRVVARRRAAACTPSEAGGRVRQRQKSGFVNVEVRGAGDTRRIAVRQPAPPLGPPAQRSRAPRGARRAGPIHRRHRHALPAAHRRRRGHSPASSACAAPSSSNSSSPTTRA